MWVLAGVCASLVSGMAVANEIKIGVVNIQRVFRDAPMAQKVQKKLEAELSKRDQELQAQAKQIRTLQEKLEKDALTMSESDRKQKEGSIADLSRDLQRKQRDFKEDLSQIQNNEMSVLQERTGRAIRQVAEAEKFDLILQEAVFVSPRIDITDKVIKALADTNGK